MIIALVTFTCILLLSLSAFFSGSETALFSLTEPEIDEMKKGNRKRISFFNDLVNSPYNLLTTVLLSNTVVNVGFSFLFALLFLTFGSELHINIKSGMFLVTFLATFLLLIFGEFTPKFYALRKTRVFSKRSILPLYYLILLLKPFVYILNLFNKFILLIGRDKGKEEISYSEIKTLLEVSEKKGIFKEQEKELINSLFTLSECVVSEVMVPRTKVFAINSDMKIEEAYGLLLEKPYSRIPVYSSRKDKVEGILYLKDLLIHRGEKQKKIKMILRDALFVPEKMRLKDLFLEFRNKRVHFAMVVNEYGGIEGIVTMDDILGEVVGSIKDEYQRVRIPLYRYISKDEILVDGELKIDDFPVSFYNRFPRGDYETVGGFILSRMGRVPKEEESFIYKELVFRIIKVQGRKLERILIRKRKYRDQET
jgi:putative hemolysin